MGPIDSSSLEFLKQQGWKEIQEKLSIPIDSGQIQQITLERPLKGKEWLIRLIRNVGLSLLIIPFFSHSFRKSWEEIFSGKEIRHISLPTKEKPAQTTAQVAGERFPPPPLPSHTASLVKATPSPATEKLLLKKEEFEAKFGLSWPQETTLEPDGHYASVTNIQASLLAHCPESLLKMPNEATQLEQNFVNKTNTLLRQSFPFLEKKARFLFNGLQPLTPTPPPREPITYALTSLRALSALEERLSAHFTFGDAEDTGDCLYDSFAQVMNRSIDRALLERALKGPCNHATIRRAIHAYIMAHSKDPKFSARASDPAFAQTGNLSMEDLVAQYPSKIETYNKQLEALKERGLHSKNEDEWKRFLNDYRKLEKPLLGAPVWGDFISDAQALHSLLKEEGIDIAFTVHSEGREVLVEAHEDDEDVDEDESEREESQTEPTSSLLTQESVHKETFTPPHIIQQKGQTLLLHETRTQEDGTVLERISSKDIEELWLIRSPRTNYDERAPGQDPLLPLPPGQSEVHIAAYGERHFFPLFDHETSSTRNR